MEEARKRLAEILDINEPTEFFKTVDKKRDDLLDDAEDCGVAACCCENITFN